jgi:hypothetical protein
MIRLEPCVRMLLFESGAVVFGSFSVPRAAPLFSSQTGAENPVRDLFLVVTIIPRPPLYRATIANLVTPLFAVICAKIFAPGKMMPEKLKPLFVA